MKKIFFMLLGVMIFITPARAQVSGGVFKINCYSELGYLSIEKKSFNGSFLKEGLDRNWQVMSTKYGVIYIPSLFEQDKNHKLIAKFPIVRNCILNNKIFEIQVIPYVGNEKGYKNCHSFNSIYVTIKTDEKLLVDKLLFDRCNYKEEYANEIIIDNEPEYESINIKGYKTYQGWYGDGDFIPVSDKTYYSERWPSFR